MEANYSDLVEMRVENVDKIIAQKINEAAERLCSKLAGKGVNMMDMKPVIAKIQQKNKFIQTLFEGSFSENTDILRRKIEKTKKRELDIVDYLSNSLLNKEIDKTLQKLLEETKSDVERITISDRKIFLKELLKRGNKLIPKENETDDIEK